jgi:hypothetical protein
MLIFALGRCFNGAALARGMFSRRRRSGADDLLLRAHGRLVIADHLARWGSGGLRPSKLQQRLLASILTLCPCRHHQAPCRFAAGKFRL